MAKSFNGLFSIGPKLLKKSYSKSSYHINYDIKSGHYSMVNSSSSNEFKGTPSIGNTPETVKKNVKNVQGWKGGAERGFLSVYPDLIHLLTKSGSQGNSSLESWYTKVLTTSLSSNFIGDERFGMIVPVTYRQLVPNATKEDMIPAHRLGWAVELARAVNALTQDCINNKEDTSKFLLNEKHNLGSKSINDSFLLQNAIHDLVNNYFADSRLHLHILQTLLEALKISAIGRTLCFENHPVSKEGAIDNLKLYRDLIRTNVSNLNYILPVRLGLHLGGLTDDKIHDQAKKILGDIGYYEELKRDYYNCFVDPQGRFIEDGSPTWLIVIAHQRATPSQKAILNECYGSSTEKALEIKRIYRELKLQKNLKKHIEEKHNDILIAIQQISKLDRVGLSQEFWFKLLTNISFN